jgi:hypothetical protein
MRVNDETNAVALRIDLEFLVDTLVRHHSIQRYTKHRRRVGVTRVSKRVPDAVLAMRIMIADSRGRTQGALHSSGLEMIGLKVFEGTDMADLEEKVRKKRAID